MWPEEPTILQHKGEATQRASFLELFFDLIFAFALARVVARAVEDLTVDPGVHDSHTIFHGAGKTLFLLLALWAVWQGTAWTTSRYDPYQPVVQLIVLIALVSSMVMGVALPRAFGTGSAVFVAGYLTAQLCRPLLLVVALHGHSRQRLKLRMLITYSVTAVAWVLGVVLAGGGAREILWVSALGIEYLAGRTGWPVPGLGRSAPATWSIAGEHLAERYQQFFLVALGQAVVVTGLAYATDGRSRWSTTAFAVALGMSILIWRIYVHRAGQVLPDAVVASRHPAWVGRSAADSHLVMVTGVITTAVGYGVAIAKPIEHAPAAWTAVILGGPAVYLVGRSRLEYEVFSRVSLSRPVALGVLALLLPALLRAAPLITLTAAGAVLAGVASTDAWRARGKPSERPAPPM